MHGNTMTAEATIWERVMKPHKNGLSAAAARALLKFGFTSDDNERMHLLAEKNRKGTLTGGEREELEAYVKIGDVLSLLHLKARRALEGGGRS